MALTKCKQCNSKIAKNALICPTCGSPGPKNKKQSILSKAISNVLAFFLLVGIGLYGMNSCVNKVSNVVESHQLTPEEKAAQEEQRKAELITRWKEDVRKQPDRQQFIQRLLNEGVFVRIQYKENIAIIWVDERFYALDFEAKKDFTNVIYSYLATEKKDENVLVELRDRRDNKIVGEHSLFGLKIK